MPYGVKYRCTHKPNVSNADVTAEVEILKKDYTGGVTEVDGDAGKDVYSLDYDRPSSLLDLLKNPIQKGRLEFYLDVGDPSSPNYNYDGAAIMQEIFVADEGEYRLRLKLDSGEVWEGPILMDLLKYPEGGYPYTGTIQARDLTVLSGKYYALSTGRVRIIDVIADLLGGVGLDKGIKAYTSWINSETNDADDFLNQIYNDTEALRKYPSTGDEDPEKLEYEDALKKILINYGLILRQADGWWRLYQVSALKDPTAVKEFTYDQTGAQTGTATVDLTHVIDRNTDYVLPESDNSHRTPLKQVNVTFDHRAKASGITFPDQIDPNTSFSQTFSSDGNQKLLMNISVSGYVDGATTASKGNVTIQVGNYWWKPGETDSDNGQWIDVNTQAAQSIDFDLTVSSGPTLNGNRPVSGLLQIETATIPSDASGSLVITFGTIGGAVGDTGYAANLQIENDITEKNASAITYQLSRSGDFSKVHEHPDTWFGDGPYAVPSALSTSTSLLDITEDSWQFRGTTSNYRNFHHNLAKEIFDPHRTTPHILEARIWGRYSASEVVSYDSKYFFFLGGSLTGYDNTWDADTFKLNVTTGSDTFEKILKFDSANNGASIDAGTRAVSINAGRAQKAAENQKITETTADLSGTVTSIPIDPVGEKFIEVGDTFYIFDILRAGLIAFTLASAQKPGDSSLSVQSKSLSNSIPSGSWVIFTGDKISSYITRSDTALRLGVRGDYDHAEFSDGEPISFQDGEPLLDADHNENVESNKKSASISILQDTIVLKATSENRLAAVSISARPEEGSQVKIVADSVDIKSVKTAINAEESVSIVADAVSINNIVFNEDAGSIETDNYEAGKSGWQIKNNGDAEFNKVEVRNGVVESSDIKNLEVKGIIQNTNKDYLIDENGFAVKVASSWTPEKAYTVVDDSTDPDTIVGGLYGNTGTVVLYATDGKTATLDAERVNFSGIARYANNLVTISAGVLDIGTTGVRSTFRSFITINNENSASTDEITSIQIEGSATPKDGTIIVLEANENAGQTTTIEDKTGNIDLATGNITLGAGSDRALKLIYSENTGTWKELS